MTRDGEERESRPGEERDGEEHESRPGGKPEADDEQAPSQTEVDDQPLGKPPPEADGDEEPLPGFPRREPPSGG